MTARHCGECTLCCRLLPVAELGKRANQRCGHQSRRGCGIYHKPGFPRSCAIWSCQWLTDPELRARRPDRSGYVVDNMPDLVRMTDEKTGAVREFVALQVWCDPARPEAWRDPALFAWIETQPATAMIVRYSNNEAIVVLSPEAAELVQPGIGLTQWGAVSAGQTRFAPTRTGSLLLDQMAEGRAPA